MLYSPATVANQRYGKAASEFQGQPTGALKARVVADLQVGQMWALGFSPASLPTFRSSFSPSQETGEVRSLCKPFALANLQTPAREGAEEP